MKQAGVESLILDLRDNAGGDPYCASYLFTYLEKEPVAYFSEANPFYPALSDVQLLAKNHFEGKLYTLINGTCFSSTGHLCSLLKYHDIGEFVGTETGGTYTCNDNSQTFQLSNTGMALKMARNKFTTAVEGLPGYQGITPDYWMAQSLEDVLYGEDQIKEFVRMHIAHLNANQ